MEQRDVVIIGAGPAGSSVAWGLRDQGLDILILDKSEFPRDKVCAGWVTPEVMQALAIDLDDYAKDNILQPITSFSTSLLGEEGVYTEFGHVVSYGIRRREFDDYLLRRCTAETRLGQGLKSLQRVDDGWLINGEIKTRLLIGAGGHYCPVARQLGAELGRGERSVKAQEIEFRLSDRQKQQCQINEATPELFFLPDLSGYAWVFRKGDYLNIGLGRDDNHQLNRHVEAFVKALQAEGKIPGDIDARFHGHAYLLQGDGRQQIVDDQVMLVGDAVGLAYAQSGEGIRPAVESGLIAAEVIAAAQGHYELAQLDTYRMRLQQRLGYAASAKRSAGACLIPPWLKQGIAQRLMRRAWFARHVVINRWFLHRQQPALEISTSRPG